MGEPRPSIPCEEGFTLIEVMTAVMIIAFAFAAIAALMIGAMKAIGVEKSRTQGNDLATVGIEDLQRLNYNSLGLCAAPSGPAPGGLDDTVLLVNCGGSPAPTAFAPCTAGSAPANSIPSPDYVCKRRNLNYTVKRYIAFGDPEHTEKRLGVFVEWIDAVGHHLVSQQSSLRIPSQSAVVGRIPPSITSASLNPSAVALNANGSNSTPINVTAQVTGLAATDSVSAVFQIFTAAGRQQASIPLSSANGTSWNGQLPAGGGLPDGGTATFGTGKQFVTFTASRQSDGKSNGFVVESVFVTNGAAPAYAPSVTITQQPPTDVDIDSHGDIDPSGSTPGGFTVGVTTENISPNDSVSLTFQTQTGVVTIAMIRDSYTNAACTIVLCEGFWHVSITPASGYHFVPADTPGQKLFITAEQVGGGTFTPIDVGATDAIATLGVRFL